MALHGNCLCKGVQFEVDEEPTMMGTCHCTRCQRVTGSSSGTAVLVAPDNFTVTQGEDLIKEYAEEGFTSRFFCSNCGSFLYGRGENMMYVGAGAFDGDPGARPQFHMMVDHKAVWEEIHDDLPQFPEYPPMG